VVWLVFLKFEGVPKFSPISRPSIVCVLVALLAKDDAGGA